MTTRFLTNLRLSGRFRLTTGGSLWLIAILALVFSLWAAHIKVKKASRLRRLAAEYSVKYERYRTDEDDARWRGGAAKFLVDEMRRPAAIPDRQIRGASGQLVTMPPPTPDEIAKMVEWQAAYERVAAYAAAMKEKYRRARDRPWEDLPPDPPAPPRPKQLGL